jgi:hypothetical protein
MLFVCGVAIWKVQNSPCILITCRTPIFRRSHPVTTASTLVGVSAALWGFRVEVPQRSEKRSRRISEPKGCSRECLAFCRAAQFPVVGTAGAVAAGHREASQRISIPGQGEDVSGDQGSAKVLTFALSIPLLKRLITGSQSLYRQVQLDEHWASRCQLSVNDQGLVIKWGSRVVVPEDKELRSY